MPVSKATGQTLIFSETYAAALTFFHLEIRRAHRSWTLLTGFEALAEPRCVEHFFMAILLLVQVLE